MKHRLMHDTRRTRLGAALIAVMLFGSSAAFSQEGRGDRGERGGQRAERDSRGVRPSARPDQGVRTQSSGPRPFQEARTESAPPRVERDSRGIRPPARPDQAVHTQGSGQRPVQATRTESAPPRADQGMRREHDARGERNVPRAAYENRIERRPPAVHHDSRNAQHAHYPGRGGVIHRLPRDVRTFHHHGRSYYHSRGVWYRPSGAYFTVVGPPVGAFVTVLPYGYTVIDFGGRPYYRYDDVYYARRDDGYVVIDPPEDIAGDGRADAAPDEVFIYPAAGQTAERQAKDRFECHDWASQQTGYDPTQVSGGVPPDQADARRADYLRAMTACLEARNYTVR